MAYIGREPQIGNYQVCDAISVVNAQAAYTMQVSSVNVIPESVNHMIVSLNGVIQKPGSSYTISSSTITFSSNLATGDSIDFIYLLGNVLDLGTPSDSTVTSAKLSGNLVTPGTLDVNGQELILDANANTSITADTDDQIDIKVGGTDQITIKDGAVSPVTDSDVDLGTTSLRFKDTFVDSITVTGEVDAATGDFSGAVDVAGAITSSASATITVAGNSDVLTLKSTDADANVGPILSLHRDSSSPADNDITGRINFRAENSAGEAIDYASMFCKLADVTDGTEDFKLIIQGMKAGTNINVLQIGEDEVIINEDSNDVDFRVETNGNANGLIVDAGAEGVRIGTNADVGQGDEGARFSTSGGIAADLARNVNSSSSVFRVYGNAGELRVQGDGDVINTGNAYGAISDRELKENEVDANSQWNDIKALKIKNYNLKATPSLTHLGVVAQDLETSGMNGLVNNNADELYTENDVLPEGKNVGDVKDKGYKSVKYSVLYMKSIKALQEAQTRIETLEDKVTTLENA